MTYPANTQIRHQDGRLGVVIALYGDCYMVQVDGNGRDLWHPDHLRDTCMCCGAPLDTRDGLLPVQTSLNPSQPAYALYTCSAEQSTCGVGRATFAAPSYTSETLRDRWHVECACEGGA